MTLPYKLYKVLYAIINKNKCVPVVIKGDRVYHTVDVFLCCFSTSVRAAVMTSLFV